MRPLNSHFFFRHSVVLLLLFSACAPLQKEGPAPTLLQAEDILSRRLDDPGLHFVMGASPSAKEWPLRYWGVDELTTAALYFNPAFEVAQAQKEVTKAAEITAGQRPNPTLGVSPSFDNSTSPSEWLFGLNLSIPIETNGKRELLIQGAQTQTQAASMRLANAAWDVRKNVVSSMAALYAAKQTERNSAALVANNQAIVDIYADRAAKGQLPTPITAQAQITYHQAVLQQEQAHEAAAQAKAALAGAVGVSSQALEDVTIITSEMEKPLSALLDIEALRKKALEQHPALKAAMLDYQAAHEALKLEIAKQVPDIDLGPGYEWNSQGGGKFTLGLSIVLPIANNNEGPIAEAEAKRKLAASTFNALQATTISAIEQATASFVTAQNTVATSEKLLGSERVRFGQLKEQLGNSETGKLPLLYAQSNIRSAEAAVSDARARCVQAAAALEDALRIPLFGMSTGILSVTQER